MINRLLTALIMAAVVSAANVPCVADESGSTRERSFLKALELFDRAATPDDYRAAARAFEAIVSDGFHSGAVYYNAGNAWFRAGEFGRAILNYRKAKPWRPRDPYLEANLQQALASAPGRLAEVSPPLWTRVVFWNQWLSFPARVRIAGLGYCIAAILTLGAFVIRLRHCRVPVIGLLMVSTLFALDAALTYHDIVHPEFAVITGETIARKGTGKDYEPAFDQPLKDGTEFKILSKTSDWVFGHFENVGDGWVRREFVAE